MSFFSIIIPVYNRTEQMGECIASILRQSFDDFEVILVDDGSEEASQKYLATLCETDSRFRVVTHATNQSVIVSRYTGMQQVQSPYTLFMDSDDSFTDNALLLLYNHLRKHPVNLLRFGHEEVYRYSPEMRKALTEKNRYISPFKTDDVLAAMLLDKTAPNVWRNCYAKAVIDKALDRAELFFCNMCEDAYWSTVLLDCAESNDIQDACLYQYNIGGGMSTNTLRRSVSQLVSYMKDIELCLLHMRQYLSAYAPQYLPLTEYKFLRMNCFLMLMFLIDEPDYQKANEYLKVFDTERLRSIYLHGQTTVLPFLYGQTNNTADDSINDRLRFSKIHYLEDLMKSDFEK